MRRTLHVLKGAATSHALAAIERQYREPETVVTVVLLPTAPVPPLPGGVIVRRIGHGLTHAELLGLIFESDQVITW